MCLLLPENVEGKKYEFTKKRKPAAIPSTSNVEITTVANRFTYFIIYALYKMAGFVPLGIN